MADSSAALWLKVFHLYGGFYVKTQHLGYYVKGSVRLLKRQVSFYKGFYVNKFKKGAVRRVFILRTRRFFVNSAGNSAVLVFYFKNNSGNLIKKKNIFLSKYTLGPYLFAVKNKRISSFFKFLI